MAFLTSANDDLIRARIGIASSDKVTIKDVFSDQENKKAKPTVNNTNIDVMTAPAKNPYKRCSSMSFPYLSVKWPITRELKRMGGTIKEHARRNSFDVEAVSISVGLNSQMTNTPGNTDVDITNAVNIISRKLVCFIVAIGSILGFTLPFWRALKVDQVGREETERNASAHVNDGKINATKWVTRLCEKAGVDIKNIHLSPVRENRRRFKPDEHRPCRRNLPIHVKLGVLFDSLSNEALLVFGKIEWKRKNSGHH